MKNVHNTISSEEVSSEYIHNKDLGTCPTVGIYIKDFNGKDGMIIQVSDMYYGENTPENIKSEKLERIKRIKKSKYLQEKLLSQLQIMIKNSVDMAIDGLSIYKW